MKIIKPIGDLEFELLKTDHSLRGLPPPEMELVCQHSCSPEKIRDCNDFNCEASSIAPQNDIDNVITQIETRRYNALKNLIIQFCLSKPATPELENLFSKFNIAKDQTYFEASVFNLVKLSQDRHDETLTLETRDQLSEIADTLYTCLGQCGTILYRQRSLDLRKGATHTKRLCLVAYECGPFLITFDKGKKTLGFGIDNNKGETDFGYLNYGIHGSPHEYRGPVVRINLNVDSATIDSVIELCETYLDKPGDETQLFISLLTEVLTRLSLPGVTRDKIDKTKGPKIFFSQLLAQLPLE